MAREDANGGAVGVGGEEELGLATRAAWLYHAGGLTQSQVAEALGVPNAKAHRLIARAARAGLVRVFVDGPIGGCIALEDALKSRYGLRFCRVVPGLDGEAGKAALPLGALGTAAAWLLHEALRRGEHRVIGVGHGRTLAAAVERLPRTPAPGVAFVSLLGGLTRCTGTNPFDVIHRLAEKTGAEAWLMPVPFLADSEADRRVLLAQRGIAEAVRMAARATLCLVGIGEVEGGAFLPASGAVTEGEVRALRAAGAVGEVLGHYFDARGRLVATPLHARVLAVMPEPTEERLVVAVAGGAAKAAAIRAVLSSGRLSGLVTDEPTAQSLAGEARQGRERGQGKGRETCTRNRATSAMPSSPAGSAAAS